MMTVYRMREEELFRVLFCSTIKHSDTRMHTPYPEKRCHYIFAANFDKILTDFQNSFTDRLANEFAVKRQ